MRTSSRYERQVIIDGFGPSGQDSLKRGRVLIVGVGGLGNPAALYLAAAGLGTIGLMDGDVVSSSNLNRQVLFRPDDINHPKVEIARQRLTQFNPEIRIVPFNQRMQDESIVDILAEFDLVLDCLDNLPDRLFLNQACLCRGTPLVHGGAIRFFGQMTTIIPGQGPCLRCFTPDGSFTGDSFRAGVLGPVPGLIGVLQAMEAVKYLSGKGEVLRGRLLVFNGLQGTVDEVLIERDPECPVCART